MSGSPVDSGICVENTAAARLLKVSWTRRASGAHSKANLSILEEAWREAEEIAAISDDLILPLGAQDFIEKARSDL